MSRWLRSRLAVPATLKIPDKAEHAQAFDRFFRRGVDAGLRDLEVKAKLTTQSDP